MFYHFNPIENISIVELTTIVRLTTAFIENNPVLITNFKGLLLNNWRKTFEWEHLIVKNHLNQMPHYHGYIPLEHIGETDVFKKNISSWKCLEDTFNYHNLFQKKKTKILNGSINNVDNFLLKY